MYKNNGLHNCLSITPLLSNQENDTLNGLFVGQTYNLLSLAIVLLLPQVNTANSDLMDATPMDRQTDRWTDLLE